MAHNHKISLGFTTQEFESGAHVSQIFNDDDEREDALLLFLLSGIKSGEKTSCFSEQEKEEAIKKFFKNQHLDFQEVKNYGALTVSGVEEVYFKNEEFNPNTMLKLIEDFYIKSVNESFNGARIIGEMTPRIENIKGGSRLLEYESRVSLLLKKFPVTAVCQYDGRLFSGSTIMDILKVHPYIIVKGSVITNPYFFEPEHYLESINQVVS